MNLITDLPDPQETVIPISKAVVSTFAKAPFIGYSTHENGSLYISNGQYILKTNQADFDDLIERVKKRRRAEPTAAVEKPELLSYVGSDRGKFELLHEPLEFEAGDSSFISLFADDKQYFGYDKKYVDVFNNGVNRLFIDDNSTYDTLSHCLVVKSCADEVLGVVLPLRLPDELCMELADVLPLKDGWKTELERIKANPTNDPYIGKEYFDGVDNHIVSAVKNISGVDMYVVPIVIEGKPSRSAEYVKVDEIENQIARWETDRIDREKDGRKPLVESEIPPVQEESKHQARQFTYLKTSPWGAVTACEKLCPGVYMVSADKKGGVVVTMDMTAAFSPAALKCGFRFNDHLCFGENGAKDVALRELLDKKLWDVPHDAGDKACYEENINKSLREHQPKYWQARKNTRAHSPPSNNAPAHAER